MNSLEYKNLEMLRDHPLLRDDERRYVQDCIRECGWAHPLTDAMVGEISKIRGDCAREPRKPRPPKRA